MNLLKTAIAAGALAVAMAGTANAATIFSETFNSAAFFGASLGLNAVEQFSDRWTNADYTVINNVNGWTFGGSAYGVRNTDDLSDGAVLLNETSGIALHLLSGLTAGQTYNVSFLVSGDNRPGSAYVLKADVNGGSTFTYNGVDLARGTNPGTTVNFSFVAAEGANTLNFYQASATEASPIIDNVTVSTVSSTPTAAVPEPATWGLMILGLGGAGAMLRRRRAALA
jgi:hypothetical protein